MFGPVKEVTANVNIDDVAKLYSHVHRKGMGPVAGIDLVATERSKGPGVGVMVNTLHAYKHPNPMIWMVQFTFVPHYNGEQTIRTHKNQGFFRVADNVKGELLKLVAYGDLEALERDWTVLKLFDHEWSE